MELTLRVVEQILVAGHTRIGRIKIPTCIACDRPLVDKVRRDQYVDVPSTLRPAMTAFAPEDKGVQEQRRGLRSRAGMEESSRWGSAGSLPIVLSRSKDGSGIYGKSLAHHPGTSLSSPSSLEGESEAPYILRGGFKMPLPGSGRAVL